MRKCLSVIVLEKPQLNSPYHYLVKDVYARNITAFRTREGFERYLQQTGLSVGVQVHESNTLERGKVEVYRLQGEYQERYFWKLEEVPAGATPFRGLVNGAYVTCYYADVGGVRTIFMPNPNAKNVYDPLPLERHIEYSRNR